jgi:hypothetical protein
MNAYLPSMQGGTSTHRIFHASLYDPGLKILLPDILRISRETGESVVQGFKFYQAEGKLIKLTQSAPIVP